MNYTNTSILFLIIFFLDQVTGCFTVSYCLCIAYFFFCNVSIRLMIVQVYIKSYETYEVLYHILYMAKMMQGNSAFRHQVDLVGLQ